MIRKKGSYRLTDRRGDIDLAVVHGFLRESYWAKEIPRRVVSKSLKNSLCFGVYHDKLQVAFARVVTDRATFAYLADVFVLPEHRGKSLAKWLVASVLEHPELRGLRRWMLATRDAHGLYAKNGFVALPRPERWMEINVPDLYLRSRAGSA